MCIVSVSVKKFPYPLLPSYCILRPSEYNFREACAIWRSNDAVQPNQVRPTDIRILVGFYFCIRCILENPSSSKKSSPLPTVRSSAILDLTLRGKYLMNGATYLAQIFDAVIYFSKFLNLNQLVFLCHIFF